MSNNKKPDKHRLNLMVDIDLYFDAKENINNISKFVSNALSDYLSNIDKEHVLKTKINKKKNEINELEKELEYLEQQLNELKEIEKNKELKEKTIKKALEKVKQVASNEGLTKQRINAIADANDLKPYTLRREVEKLKERGELTIHKKGTENIKKSRDKTETSSKYVMDTSIYGKLKKDYNRVNNNYKKISSEDKTREAYVQEFKNDENKIKQFNNLIKHHNKKEKDNLTLDLLLNKFLNDKSEIRELNEKEMAKEIRRKKH